MSTGSRCKCEISPKNEASTFIRDVGYPGLLMILKSHVEQVASREGAMGLRTRILRVLSREVASHHRLKIYLVRILKRHHLDAFSTF